jgi:hypothetical protein
MYPLGSGCSKMLQIVNINEKKDYDLDILNTNHNNISQTVNNKKFINTTVNLNYSLPKLKPKQKKEKSLNKNKNKHNKNRSLSKINDASLNVSFDDKVIRDEDELTSVKVTKIYKIKENK